MSAYRIFFKKETKLDNKDERLKTVAYSERDKEWLTRNYTADQKGVGIPQRFLHAARNIMTMGTQEDRKLLIDVLAGSGIAVSYAHNRGNTYYLIPTGESISEDMKKEYVSSLAGPAKPPPDSSEMTRAQMDQILKYAFEQTGVTPEELKIYIEQESFRRQIAQQDEQVGELHKELKRTEGVEAKQEVLKEGIAAAADDSDGSDEVEQTTSTQNKHADPTAGIGETEHHEVALEPKLDAGERVLKDTMPSKRHAQLGYDPRGVNWYGNEPKWKEMFDTIENNAWQSHKLNTRIPSWTNAQLEAYDPFL